MAEPDFKATIVVCSHRDIKVSSLACLWVLRDCPSPKVSVIFQDGDALISRSRSIRATQFLKESNDDVLMFIDDDVTISPVDATKLLWLAHKEKLPIVGAAYATKSKKKPGFAIDPLESGTRFKFGKNGGLYEVKNISTGCMAIRREVLQKMVDSESVHYCVHGDRKYYPFFQHREMLDGDVWRDFSEDWYLCYVARRLGFGVWMDTTIKTGHIGPYEFTWSDVYEANAGMRKEYDDIQFRSGPPKEENKIIVPSPTGWREDLKKLIGV